MNGITAAFTGRLGKDPEFKLALSGKRYVGFSVAVDRDEHRMEDRPEAETHWVRVVAFEELAHRLEAEGRLTRGAAVYCEGRLKLEQWYTSRGEPRCGLALSARVFQAMGASRRRSPRHDGAPAPVNAGPAAPPDDLEDLPV